MNYSWRGWGTNGEQRFAEHDAIWYVGANWRNQDGWRAILFRRGKIILECSEGFASMGDAKMWADKQTVWPEPPPSSVKTRFNRDFEV